MRSSASFFPCNAPHCPRRFMTDMLVCVFVFMFITGASERHSRKLHYSNRPCPHCDSTFKRILLRGASRPPPYSQHRDVLRVHGALVSGGHRRLQYAAALFACDSPWIFLRASAPPFLVPWQVRRVGRRVPSSSVCTSLSTSSE